MSCWLQPWSRPAAADFIDFPFDRQPIERFEPQAGEQLDAGFERVKRDAEGSVLLGFRAFASRRIRHAPMRRHRVTGPDRADLAGGLVADGKDEVHLRGARLGEFVPTLTAQPARIEMSLFKKVERQGVNGAPGKAAGSIPLEPSSPPMREQNLGHDASRRVSRAEK